VEAEVPRESAAALTLTTPSEREIVITRSFKAPRELVFAAWTEPRHVKRWWGPNGFTTPHCEIDLRVGGAYHIDMRGPDGTIYPTTGTYKEVTPPARLVYTEVFGCLGQPDTSSLVTVTFAERNGVTTVTLHSLFDSLADRDAHIRVGVEKGWSECFEHLAAYLPKMQSDTA
jgi:uncharacterized protein YndB with AHSA1/START domain